MSTLVTASIPADQFALAETLERVPDAEFETVRTVAHGSDGVMPFLWASGDVGAIRRAVREDPSTETVEVLAEVDGELLLETAWTADVRVMLYLLVEQGATILDAVGRDGGWQFRVLFPEHDALSATGEFCDDHDVDLDVRRVHEVADSFRRGQFGLTEEQYDTIVEAFDGGYYDVPRETSLNELAEGMDVTHQALSERIRRGHATLVENGLRPPRAALAADGD